jgi:hypothetical protein
MTGRYTSVLVLTAMMLVSQVVSAAEKKIPIFLNTDSKDTVGTNFIYSLREQLKASRSYDVVLRQQDAVFVIGVVTIDDSGRSASDPMSTVTSVVLSINNTDGYDYLLNQWVMSIGRDRTSAMATDLIAAIDKDVQEAVRAAVEVTNEPARERPVDRRRTIL